VAVSLGHQVATLVLEVCGVLAAVVVLIALTVGRRPNRAELRLASGAVVGVLAVALTLGEIPSGAALLQKAHSESVSATAGVEHCFGEVWPQNPGGVGVAHLPFLRWLKARIGPHAVYALDYAAPPDPYCILLNMLPALYAAPGEHAEWTIAWGTIPAEMQARIAAHDPSVRVFAPGFALQSNGKS
jgi:hypothetical protein